MRIKGLRVQGLPVPEPASEPTVTLQNSRPVPSLG